MLNKTEKTKASQAFLPGTDFTRAPKLIRSTLFSILFSTAVFLTVISIFQALSADPEQTRQAYPTLVFNFFLIVALGIYLGGRVWFTLFATPDDRSAPLLHRRFLLIFSLAALLPAFLVGVFSTSLISKNINEIFGQNVRTTLNNSYEFLDQYLSQELFEFTTPVLTTKSFIESNADRFEDRISFTAYLQRFARELEIDSIYVLDREGRIYTRVVGTRSPELRIPAAEVFDYVEQLGQPAMQTRKDVDYMLGFAKLQNYENLFLLAGQPLKSEVGILSSISGIEEAERSLENYSRNQDLFQKIFLLTFIESALLIFFAAVWVGTLIANRVTEPVSRLVTAAEKVRGGDLSARVHVQGQWGEISDLGGAFNRMTQQLATQREDLVREHETSELRRQFSEAVLSGVRAGVIGLNPDGRISVMNKSAEILTGVSSGEALWHPLEDILPEFADVFLTARENVVGRSEDQVSVETESGILHFHVRVSAYEAEPGDTGWVLTFDDMTRLVAAQRHSAWREVARRIAHEIKNPLTPIMLSTERLKRKYGKEISSDRTVFDTCTDTIIRQVSSLERMVDEFSSFARMPQPVFASIDVADLFDGILFAQRVAFPDIRFEFEDKRPAKERLSADERLLSQALTNLYKNAGESILQRVDEAGIDDPDGLIRTQVSVSDDNLVVTISDNGKGWPFPDTDRLLEPYVTTRDTGTGLGLPIVKRIVEDHGGQIRLEPHPDIDPGARVIIILPVAQHSRSADQDNLSEIEAEVSLDQS